MSEREKLTDDDAQIAELLRRVGTRSEPSIEMAREVQAAVHAEWLDVVASRRRRRTVVWAAAASIGVLAIGAAIGVRLMDEQGRPIATLQRVEGEMYVAADGSHWTRVNTGQRIAVGDSVRSDARSALQLDSGVALRLDRGTALTVIADERFALNAGAVYVDSKPGKGANPLTIETHAGDVWHLGTQYQVRTRIDGIDVSVREGRVMIEGENGNNTATAGERVTVSTQGAVLRSRLSPTDEQWRWASEVAPTFVIENASLAAFLDWVARETGRPLVYTSSRARSTATDEILHGSIEGLAPDVALKAVLATTPLRHDQARTEVIEIGLATSIDSQQSASPAP